jgi:hypothetical protein
MVDLFDVLAEKGNFKVKYQLFRRNSRNQIELLNDLGMGIINMIIKIMNHQPNYHITSTFNDVFFIFTVRPAEYYSNFEKMALPFDTLTWYFLIITFSLAFATIFCINRLPPRIQVMFYGIGVKTPALNVLTIFFGVGQARLPSLHFSRIILMAFIIFCLIIRTAYQGVFYEMFMSDIRKPWLKNIAELVEKNFNIASFALFKDQNDTMNEIFHSTGKYET